MFVDFMFYISDILRCLQYKCVLACESWDPKPWNTLVKFTPFRILVISPGVGK